MQDTALSGFRQLGMIPSATVNDRAETDLVGHSELGDLLKRTRDMRGLSLKAVAGPAGISATYLQKLERGQVSEPSPHVLHRLAEALGLSYLSLMALAGYVVPKGESEKSSDEIGALSHALSSEPLTDEEAAQLAEYLAFLRHQRRSAR